MTSTSKDDSNSGMFSKLFNLFNYKKDDDFRTSSKRNYSLIHQSEDSKMWISDDNVQKCHNCDKEFNSIFIRKHHCRICGNIFCYDCCNRSIEELVDDLIGQKKVCEKCSEKFIKLKQTLNETTINRPLNNYIHDSDKKTNIRRETTYSIYCRNLNVESNECYNYLKLDRKSEDQIKKYLDNQAEALVKNMIANKLKIEGLYEKWNDKVYELVRSVITNVFPSIRDLKDTLNINDYVKIKQIIFHDQSLTKYIHGFAMQKNVCFKKMKTRINEPKILMLEECGNDLLTDGLTRNTNEQQNEYLKIIVNKIEKVDPDLVLVSSNVPYRIQEILAKNERTLVMKMKQKSLTRIARIAKTYILPSTDLVDSQVILGSCKKFYVERYEYKNIKDINIYNLMVFENYDSILGCTIILSGPDKKEMERVKKTLLSLILSARDIYLQKVLLYFSFYNPLPIENENRNKIVSNNKGNQSSPLEIQNRNTCIYNKNDKENTEYFQSFIDGFDTTFTHFQPSFYLIKLTFVQENYITTESSSSFNQIDPSSNLNENDILRTLNKKCGETQILELFFYNNLDIHDKCLGNLILDLTNQKDLKCDKCKYINKNHIYYIYKNNCRVKINFVQDEITEKLSEYIIENASCISPIKNKNYNTTIYMYGYCNICHAVVTPLTKVHREIFNFSFAKYIKVFLFNHKLRNRMEDDFNIFITSKYPFVRNNCNHFINKDISRVFLTDNGAIKFTFENSAIYMVEPCAIIDSKDSIQNVSFDDKQSVSFTSKSVVALKFLNYYYQHLSNELENFNNHEEGIKYYVNNLKDKVSKQTEKISELLNFNSYLPCYKNEDFFKMCLIKKKLYARIIQIKIIFQKLWRCTKLLKKYANQRYNTPVKRMRDSPIMILDENSEIKDQLNISNNLTQQINSIPSFNIPSSQREYTSFNSSPKINTSNVNNSPQIIFNNNNIFNENNKIIPIDKQFSIIDVLMEINFFKDTHTKIINDLDIDDMGSIIIYALTSDRYRDSISSKKFKLLSIKCDRKVKKEEIRSTRQSFYNPTLKPSRNIINVPNQGNNNNLLSINRETLDESKLPSPKNSNLFELDIKSFSHLASNIINRTQNLVEEDILKDDLTSHNIMENEFITTEDEEVYETSLLFDPNKNQYYDDIKSNIENHNIQQQLETELLSDDKSHFSFVFNNFELFTFLTSTTINFDINKKKDNTETDDKNKDHCLSENMKSLCEELDKIRADLQKINELNEVSKTKKKLEFYDDNLFEIEVIIYFSRQFEALRVTYCSSYDELIFSLLKSISWSDVTGGKSKAGFYKSLDNKYVLKCINKYEFKMFLEAGFQYFHHIAKYFFHRMPSALAKILGAYKIKKKNLKANKVETYYILLMENLFYNKENKTKSIRTYDLKGSRSNRYIIKRDQKDNQVLPDTNFKIDFKGNPLPLEKNIAELLRAAVHNDSLVLCKMNVVDYSLLLIIDENVEESNSLSIINEKNDKDSTKEIFHLNDSNIKTIRVGIIDYVRKYTWDKQLEHVGKFIINRLEPTIVDPKMYRLRFIKTMNNYFLGLG